MSSNDRQPHARNTIVCWVTNKNLFCWFVCGAEILQHLLPLLLLNSDFWFCRVIIIQTNKTMWTTSESVCIQLSIDHNYSSNKLLDFLTGRLQVELVNRKPTDLVSCCRKHQVAGRAPSPYKSSAWQETPPTAPPTEPTSTRKETNWNTGLSHNSLLPLTLPTSALGVCEHTHLHTQELHKHPHFSPR